MAAYIVRRLIWVVFLLFVITLITFVIFSVLPAGDPGGAARRTPAVARAGRVDPREPRLDKSKPEQFIDYLGDILPFVGHDGFNFGYSYQNNTEVLPGILDRLPTTMVLAGGAVILWLAIGIPIGMISAVKTRSVWDRLSMGLRADRDLGARLLPRARRAVPVRRRHRQVPDPARATRPTARRTTSGRSSPRCSCPWCVLAAAFAAIYARFLRGNLIDVLQEDYIRTARAKGLSERTVIFKHGVRAAITPIVTLLGLDIGILLGGAILTETVFNIQGIGRYAFDAINRSDLPVIQGTVLFGAFFIVIMSLVVDICYAFLDPRVRY